MQRRRRGVLRLQKRLATEHAVFDDVGSGEAVREPQMDRACSCPTSLCCAWHKPAGGDDPAKHALLAKKEELEQKIDTLNTETAMESQDYKKH